jgi:hypothetical protein
VLTVPSDDDNSLRTDGSLGFVPTDFTIHGRTAGGIELSLFRCLALTDTEILPHLVLTGGHFESAAEDAFRFCEAEFTDVPEWLGAIPFRPVTQAYEEGGRLLKIEESKELVAEYERTQIVLNYGAEYSSGRTGATVAPYGVFWLTAETGIPISDWQNRFIRPLRYLLTLLVGRACVTRAESLIEKESLRHYVEAREQVPQIELFGGKQLSGPKTRARAHPIGYLCDSEIPFDRVIPRWLKTCEEMALPVDLLFAGRFAPFMYVESYFLSLVQAAEGYHRSRFPGRTSLQQRLLDLLARADELGLGTTDADRKDLAGQLVRARNDLSHGGLSSSARELAYSQLNRQLRVLLETLLVGELHLSGDWTKRAVRELKNRA